MSEKTVRVLSLGAGVQSSALYLMYLRGDLPNPPAFAIFADTHAEPKAVYEWLDMLVRMSGADPRIVIPIHRVSAGDIVADTLGGARYASPPFFVMNPDGTSAAVRRQCTSEYKIAPILKGVRTLLGYKPRRRVRETVEMILGMSLDEPHRLKRSQERWIKNVYPLAFEKPMRRHECEEYIRALGFGDAPRSACWMCPYRSDREWLHLKATEPETFQKAVNFDQAIRKSHSLKGQNFVHRSMKPLADVDLDPLRDQIDLFGNECEGMCGA